MKFTKPDIKLSEDDIERVETALRIRFPEALRSLFIENNGARPSRGYFEGDELEFTIEGTFPLVTEAGRRTAVEVYNLLVLEKDLAPSSFFPFGFDSGGLRFFVDCDTEDARVHCYDPDTVDEGLYDLEVSLKEFWKRLTKE
jgi:hypothetical protein